MKHNRMNRRNFAISLILGFIGANVLLIVSTILDSLNISSRYPSVNVIVGVMIIAMAIYLSITWLLATIKRLHDIDVTGWLSIVFLATPAIIVLAFIPGTKGTNSFGTKPARTFNLRATFLWMIR